MKAPLLRSLVALSGLSLTWAETPEDLVLSNLTRLPKITFYETKSLPPEKAQRVAQTALQELKTIIRFLPGDKATATQGSLTNEVKVEWGGIRLGRIRELPLNEKERLQGVSQKFDVDFVAEIQNIQAESFSSASLLGGFRVPIIAHVTVIAVEAHFISFPAEIPALNEPSAYKRPASEKTFDANGRKLPDGMERQ